MAFKKTGDTTKTISVHNPQTQNTNFLCPKCGEMTASAMTKKAFVEKEHGSLTCKKCNHVFSA